MERCFNRLKQWRDLATRYAKRASLYRASLVLTAAIIWLLDKAAVGYLGEARHGQRRAVHFTGGDCRKTASTCWVVTLRPYRRLTARLISCGGLFRSSW